MALTKTSVPIVPRAREERDIPGIVKWMEDVRRYLNSSGGSQQIGSIIFAVNTTEPQPIIGTMARADGVGWDPGGFGLGGLYYYNGTAWVKVA